MERDTNQFSPELLQMMRNEEREKFLNALKNGASWGQLYQIRRTIKKLNDMIEAADRDRSEASSRKNSSTSSDESRGNEPGPRDSNTH